MGHKSAIEWTDHTFNPWWGCTKVSPGCAHCYAETWAHRHGHDVWGERKARRTFGEKHWQEPYRWNRQATEQGRRARVFCASMADVFEDNPLVEPEREKLWAVIGDTPMLDWLLLTKRPENMLRFAPWKERWPTNVWAMVSVEDQRQAEQRMPLLVAVPAVVRGVSVEPLLGAVNLEAWLAQVHWVIVGGESGHHARPLHPAWVYALREQCQGAGVAFFFKQWGEWRPTTLEAGGARLERLSESEDVPAPMMKRVGKKTAGRLLDGRTWDEVPGLQEGASARWVSKEAEVAL